jgi:hypothetical protein
MHAAGQQEHSVERNNWENDEIGDGRDERTRLSSRNVRGEGRGSWGQVNRKPSYEKLQNLTPKVYEKM